MRDLLERIDRRTWLGIGMAAIAAFLVLVVTRPTPTVTVMVAGTDLPAGIPLSQLDLKTEALPTSLGILLSDDLEGVADWTLAEPVVEGEPILPSLLRAPAVSDNPDLFALSVESSHAVLGRVTAGDYVDIYVTWNESDETERLAQMIYVVEARSDDSGFGDSQVQMLLAVDIELAEQMTKAVRGGELDIVKRAA